jgi:predicted Zn-dependent protease
MKVSLSIKLFLFSATLLISACVTTPTGRNQLILFSDAQVSASGAQAFTAMKSQQKITSTGSVNDYVLCVANAITAQVEGRHSQTDWEVVVFDDPQANAFALPGGKIGVYTGLLEVTKNQHQLAAVIGHEVAHVIAQHGNERMSQSTLIGLGQQAVAEILTANEVANTPMIMSALGLGIQFGVALPYSRTHETEADTIGLELMARAGFDPRQSITLWKNMAAANAGQRPPEFLSTHPDPDTRITNLSSKMPQAMTLFNTTTSRPQCG